MQLKTTKEACDNDIRRLNRFMFEFSSAAEATHMVHQPLGELIAVLLHPPLRDGGVANGIGYSFYYI